MPRTTPIHVVINYLVLVVMSILFSACGNNVPDYSLPLEERLSTLGFSPDGFDVFIRAFKYEETLEVWVSKRNQNQFSLLKSYAICKSSGVLGPKRKEGDLQVPEGCYHIDRLNPNSSYHLSLGINYPNKSDRIRGDQQQPGSDIFIHGACVTVGCIPLTDALIEEVYTLVATAMESGQQKVAVHIFPARLDNASFNKLISHQEHISFWRELQAIYTHFEEHQQIPEIGIDGQGAYYLKP